MECMWSAVEKARTAHRQARDAFQRFESARLHGGSLGDEIALFHERMVAYRLAVTNLRQAADQIRHRTV
jgi:hypothetical protein